MSATELNQPLVGERKPNKTYTYEIIQSLLFMVAYSTGLGILGSTYTFEKFHIDSLLADFLVMIFVMVTYTVSHHIIAYCCRESSEKYNFAEYLEDHFGKVAALVYDVLMTVHNIVLLAYIQFFVAHFMVEGRGAGNGDKAYYFLAIVNIPLIFVSLSTEFKKIRWFCVALLLCWVYIFIGRLVEISTICTSEQYWDEFPVASSHGIDTWVIKLIGLQLYFASAFQSLPFIYKEAKKQKIMSKVINLSAAIVPLIYLSVYIFYTLDPASAATGPSSPETSGNSTANTETETEPAGPAGNGTVALEAYQSCKTQLTYEYLTDYGRVLAGACAIIINVIPARFSLAQLLSGNDAETMKKASSSDKLLSALLIMCSIIMSLFMFNTTFWRVTVCLGVFLSCILGVFVPAIALLYSKEYRKAVWPNKPYTVETENKNKHHFITMQDNKKKIFIFAYLTWASIFGILGIVSGFFIMTDS
jgi:hypothetical protein